ncbi:Alpha/beta hydrolase fold-1 [Kalmanozyma brasiliensis GHG001]|uniref:Proline iminopeptidase n=1 Tax=Kalmanozyma brasiliensis (strain GHG001) TaxID=1365824 RepID=V5F167_KALBG|nr:Alpha/beta hydrolase fold-1 [Kalmanozyma brasiliensis GHG001]EST10048.1 Alpha/beta hydrolase fold-1 [Kalmanozyma brasiliensis GHG001]
MTAPSSDNQPKLGLHAADVIDYSESARSLSGYKTTLRQPYPAIEPFESGTLAVDSRHTLFYEWSGNPSGQPIICVHGGPGGGIWSEERRWFDPAHYRILTFDQRGAGQSTPHADLVDNTTWHLVADIEKLREKFGVQKWHVFGGSWGSTLSLAYAQKHPERVSALILRGIFTLRKSELSFFYQGGASHIFPEQWDIYRDGIPEAERNDFITAYNKRLTSDDSAVRLDAARRWSTWENSTSKLYVDANSLAKGEDDDWALAFARIENHYFINEGWMRDGQLLEKSEIDKIRHIPATIVQGRYDVVCPATTAWELHKVWPEAEFHMVPDAGHSAKEPGIADILVKATDKYRSIKG